jgi:hypothetical protein
MYDTGASQNPQATALLAVRSGLALPAPGTPEQPGDVVALVEHDEDDDDVLDRCRQGGVLRLYSRLSCDDFNVHEFPSIATAWFQWR